MKPSGDEDPWDSFPQKKRVSLLEPKKQTGSFSVKESVEIVTDINQCSKLWQEFNPAKSLFDSWEFRLAFYKGYKYEPYFLLLKNGHEVLAILPLWYDLDKKRYTWFGSDWQEEVRFYAKAPSHIQTLLLAAPPPLFLNAIAQDSIEPIKELIGFEADDPKYILSLAKLKNHEDYLMNLKKNRRHDLRKDRRRIEKQNPEIIINNFDDFKYLIKLSKKRFQEKGEKTDWEDVRRITTFKEVIRLSGKSYQTRMITIKIDGRIAGVDLICLSGGTYYTVKCGYDVQSFSGIGNFMNLLEIDDAIKLKMEKIDFLQNNYGWKSQYFQPLPLFKYRKAAALLDIRLRSCRPSDLKRTNEIEKCSFCIDAYSQERLDGLYRNHPDDFIVAEKDDSVLGYIIVCGEGNFANFISLAVDKDYRYLGVGSLLVSFMLARFKRRGFKKAFLEVRTTNEEALSFYQNLGFKIIETVENYYKDGETAHRMEKTID